MGLLRRQEASGGQQATADPQNRFSREVDHRRRVKLTQKYFVLFSQLLETSSAGRVISTLIQRSTGGRTSGRSVEGKGTTVAREPRRALDLSCPKVRRSDSETLPSTRKRAKPTMCVRTYCRCDCANRCPLFHATSSAMYRALTFDFCTCRSRCRWADRATSPDLCR